jgi:hypothetical protein
VNYRKKAKIAHDPKLLRHFGHKGFVQTKLFVKRAFQKLSNPIKN